LKALIPGATLIKTTSLSKRLSIIFFERCPKRKCNSHTFAVNINKRRFSKLVFEKKRRVINGKQYENFRVVGMRVLGGNAAHVFSVRWK
jgi:hypothetical protein